MKRIVLTFIICLLLPGFANARYTIDKTAFDKLVDYINTELTRTYLDNFPSEKLIPQERALYKDSIRPTLMQNAIDTPVSFTTLHRLLTNNGFSTTLTSVSDEINWRKKFYDSTRSNAELLNSVLTIKLENNLFHTLTYKRIKSLESELTVHLEKQAKKQAITDSLNNIAKKKTLPVKLGKKNTFIIYLCLSGLLYCICVCSYLLYTKKKRQMKYVK